MILWVLKLSGYVRAGDAVTGMLIFLLEFMPDFYDSRVVYAPQFTTVLLD